MSELTEHEAAHVDVEALIAQRDQARRIAVALEQEVAELTRPTVTADQVDAAAVAACRAVWASAHGGSWDTDCPDRPRWVREELEALLPALECLGIEVQS